jgi:hypothetical protein
MITKPRKYESTKKREQGPVWDSPQRHGGHGEEKDFFVVGRYRQTKKVSAFGGKIHNLTACPISFESLFAPAGRLLFQYRYLPVLKN